MYAEYTVAYVSVKIKQCQIHLVTFANAKFEEHDQQKCNHFHKSELSNQRKTGPARLQTYGPLPLLF